MTAEELTDGFEDMLLEFRQRRKNLSEKALCKRFEISRSKLQRAVRRARRRQLERERDAKCLTTDAILSGK